MLTVGPLLLYNLHVPDRELALAPLDESLIRELASLPRKSYLRTFGPEA